MTRFLLDVNVLLALIDPDHVWHEKAHLWFAAEGGQAWATCPITENGILRIAGNVRYPNCPGSPAEVAKLLLQLRAVPGHEFWHDNLTLLDEQQIQISHLSDSKQITDTYLLALASSREGRLATFDRRLVTTAVKRGQQALYVIS